MATFEDWLSICETKAQYCRCLDTKDWDGLSDCYTQDLVLDSRPIRDAVIEGRDVVVANLQGSLSGMVTVHQVHTPEVRFQGDEAEVVWALQDHIIWPEERREAMKSKAMTGYGHYHERYRKCPDGKWRIAYQRVAKLHTEMHPL